MAAGFALTGWLVDAVGPGRAFYATVLFSVMAFVVVLAAQKWLSASPAHQAKGAFSQVRCLDAPRQ